MPQSLPLPAFIFRVEIDGIAASDFLAVEGLESLTDVIEYRSGAEVNSSARKLPGRHHTSNVVLRRALTPGSDLFQWRQSIVNGVLEKRAMSVIFLDNARQEVMRFNLFEVWPCRWSLSALDALESEVVLEELELVAEKIELA